jgi:hypothetical protein
MPPWDRRPRSYYWFAGRTGGEKRGQAERARYRGGDVALKPDDANHTMDMALVGLQVSPEDRGIAFEECVGDVVGAHDGRGAHTHS